MIRRTGEGRRASQQRASLLSSAQYDFEEGQRVGIQKSDRGPAKAGSLGKYNRSQGNTPGNTPNRTTSGGGKMTSMYSTTSGFGDDGYERQDGPASPYTSKGYKNAYDTGSTYATTPRAGATSPRSPRMGENGESSPSRRDRTPGRRKDPCPKPRDEGRWVKHEKNLDSRGGTQLRGGLFREDPSLGLIEEPAEDPHDHLDKLHRKDMGDHTVKFCGFTDRTIRLQDGNAMKAVFNPPEAWSYEKTECKPNCMCPVCKPMRSSLLPPAGQVMQVDVGNAGTPPYVLQTQVTGMMAVMPEPKKEGAEKATATIEGRKSSLATSFGRHFFKKQRLPDYKDFDKKVSENIVARGCEIEEKGVDRMQVSTGVAQAMSGELGDDNDSMEQMRREVGQKTRLDAPGVELNTMKGMLVYDDGDAQKIPHLTKKRVEASWTKTKIFLGHIEPELASPPSRSLRKQGDFFGSIPAFSREQMRRAQTGLLRYEGCPTAYLQGTGCTGVGDPTRDQQMRDFRHYKTTPFGDHDDIAYLEERATPGATPRATPRQEVSRSASCPPAAMRSGGDLPVDADLEGRPEPPLARGERPAQSGELLEVPTPSRRRESVPLGGFAGVPSGYFRETGRGKQFSDQGLATKMSACMAHATPEDELKNRSRRISTEPKFAEMASETTALEAQQRRVFKSILESIHHLGSASVQDALTWSG